MPDTTRISETEAIRQVIQGGIAMDYIDVVNEVQKRFRMDVTSDQVEQVMHDLATSPRTKISLAMTSKLPDGSSQPDAAQPKSKQSSQMQPPPPTDDLGHAMQFVKSVQGLTNAKRALAELESILLK